MELAGIEIFDPDEINLQVYGLTDEEIIVFNLEADKVEALIL